MSLSKAVLSLGSNIFSYGQAYVALSRIESFKGLTLLDFDYTKIKSNPNVLKFFNILIINYTLFKINTIFIKFI